MLSMSRLKTDALCADLMAVSWSEILATDLDVNKMLENFNDSFLRIWDKHAPITVRRIRKHRTPWMNTSVLELEHKRDAAYKQFLRTRNDNSYRAYKILRNAVTQATRRAKQRIFYSWCIFWIKIILKAHKTMYRSRRVEMSCFALAVF
jgi:hypothetical protein